MFAHRTEWELRPNRFAQALAEHKQSAETLIDLTASNPPEANLEYDAGAILAAFNNRAALNYCPEPRGLTSARTAIVEYYAEVAQRAGLNGADAALSIENLFLTTSTSEAYTYVFRLLCDPGDEVLIPTPSYPLFEYLAGLQDVNLISYMLFYDHGWHIDFHALQQAIGPRTRGIILVNPNNPTGSFVSVNEKEQLNALCRKRELALVVDEVFLDYTLDQARPSFAFNRGALTFTLSGISKISGLPQMKLAWLSISGPTELVATAAARMEVIADTYLSLSAPTQLAAPVLLAQRHRIQQQLSSRIRKNLAELDRQLKGSIVNRLQVDGGWYAILRVPRTRADEELAIALLERENVLVQPGFFYDLPSEGHLVVSLITPPAIFAEGIARLLDFLH